MDIIPLFSTPDRPACLPSYLWENKLLADSIDQLTLEDGLDLKKISTMLNNLALLLNLQGNSIAAEKICNQHMIFCSNLAKSKGNSDLLKFMVQPFINKIRLSRNGDDLEKVKKAYSSLLPINRGNFLDCGFSAGLSLNHIASGLQAHDAIDVVDNVYWIEYARYLLQTNQLELAKSHCSSGLKASLKPMVRVSLLEIFLISDACIGLKSSLFSYIDKLLDSIKSDRWAFFVIFLLKLQIKNGFCIPLTKDEIKKSMSLCFDSGFYEKNIKDLLKLNSVIRVFKIFNDTESEIKLLNLQESISIHLNDEVSLFLCMQRKMELGYCTIADMQFMFSNSNYSIIRKKCGMPQLDNSLKLNGILSGLEKLSQLDYSGCKNDFSLALNISA